MIKEIWTIDQHEGFLRKKCLPIADNCFEQAIQVLEDLADTFAPMSKAGAGLAAPQIGYPFRIFLLQYQGLDIRAINPELIKAKGSHLVKEACFSIPGKIFTLKRPDVVKVRYTDIHGVTRSIRGHGLTAQALMHELDHLDGILVDKR